MKKKLYNNKIYYCLLAGLLKELRFNMGSAQPNEAQWDNVNWDVDETNTQRTVPMYSHEELLQIQIMEENYYMRQDALREWIKMKTTLGYLRDEDEDLDFNDDDEYDNFDVFLNDFKRKKQQEDNHSNASQTASSKNFNNT